MATPQDGEENLDDLVLATPQDREEIRRGRQEVEKVWFEVLPTPQDREEIRRGRRSKRSDLTNCGTEKFPHVSKTPKRWRRKGGTLHWRKLKKNRSSWRSQRSPVTSSPPDQSLESPRQRSLWLLEKAKKARWKKLRKIPAWMRNNIKQPPCWCAYVRTASPGCLWPHHTTFSEFPSHSWEQNLSKSCCRRSYPLPGKLREAAHRSSVAPKNSNNQSTFNLHTASLGHRLAIDTSTGLPCKRHHWKNPLVEK